MLVIFRYLVNFFLKIFLLLWKLIVFSRPRFVSAVAAYLERKRRKNTRHFGKQSRHSRRTLNYRMWFESPGGQMIQGGHSYRPSTPPPPKKKNGFGSGFKLWPTDPDFFPPRRAGSCSPDFFLVVRGELTVSHSTVLCLLVGTFVCFGIGAGNLPWSSDFLLLCRESVLRILIFLSIPDLGVPDPGSNQRN